MIRLKFEGKGRTLEALKHCVKKSIINPLLVITVSEWRSNRESILKKIPTFFKESKLIIRSSCRSEDTKSQSLAGRYLSISDISTNKSDEIEKAINDVISSYSPAQEQDEFIIQEQLLNIKICGVLFTRDLDTLAPYYIFNYDESGSSDSVTSGRGKSLKTYVRMRTSPYSIAVPTLNNVLESARELETLFDSDKLDIEFAVSNDESVYIFQVRPITTPNKYEENSDILLESLLLKIKKKASKLTAPHPGLCGKTGMYSVMTDWNPAEIIGIRPRRLSLSLYKELVTDSIWAHQRFAYGYRDLRGYPLLLSFLGQPYIDVRVSINSFVPRMLDSKLADKLVDYYIERLARHPTDHDKLEFKIVHSCYYLNVAEKLKDLLEHGFSELEIDRIKYALLDLTNGIISPRSGLYLEDLEKVDKLSHRYDEILNSDLPTIEKIYWLVRDCKRLGTLPFAGLARAGFIAMQFLHSLVELKIISEDDFQAYMNSLNTIAKQLSCDTQAYANENLSKEEMIKKYGHLRPGTYDILSPSYSEQFDKYLGNLKKSEKDSRTDRFEFTAAQKLLIGDKIIENGLNASVEDLLSFIKAGIEGREYSKFIFTRSLSQVLIQIEKLGKRNEISREDLSYIDIRSVLNLYSDLTHENVREILLREATINKESAKVTSLVKLPQLIRHDQDVYDFFIGEVEANFITHKAITEFIILEESLLESDLNNKIVFIRSADPGYDWVFSRNIGGLVTMYGGANSHMAIRCAELQIPAVIGCGEKNFAEWSKSQVLSIDCSNKIVKSLQ